MFLSKKSSKLKVWELVFLILGSPIWLSLLVALFAIFLSAYIVLWAIIICLWANFASILGVGLAMILSGIIFVFTNNNFTWFALIGVGMVCIGLSILLFFGGKITTKLVILLTSKIILWIKNCFSKKEIE